MIYSQNDYLLYSLIYSEIEKNGRFVKSQLDSELLIELFLFSLKNKINIFRLNSIQIKEFIEQNIQTKREKPKEKLIGYFSNKDYLGLENQINTEIELCSKHGINIICYEDENYPKSLKNIKDPPITLFYKGNMPTDEDLQKSIAIIGSREMEKQYGEKIAFKAGKVISELGYWNISGLALGADEYGHKGSLDSKGLTGAVVAYGLSQEIYPAENKDLANQILTKNGFIMSELPPSTKLQSHFLILRDRMQSGLTQGIFVVETGIKSGTLHTIEYAAIQGKLIMIWDIDSAMKKISEQKFLEMSRRKEVQGNRFLLDKFDSSELKNLNQNVKDYFDIDEDKIKTQKIYKIKNKYSAHIVGILDSNELIEKLQEPKARLFMEDLNEHR